MERGKSGKDAWDWGDEGVFLVLDVCAGSGAGGRERSGAPGLLDVVFRKGLGLGGIECGGLVKVVGDKLLSGLVGFRRARAHVEFGLGWTPGHPDQGWRDRLADMGELWGW